MKILFVVNNYFCKGNGLDESARRTVQALRDAGQEVRVLSGPNLEDLNGPHPDFEMENFHFPLMQPMLDSFGYNYADWHGPKIEEAVRNAENFDENAIQIIRVTNMEEAVQAAAENTVEGDIVSLSPASASFGLYKNFEERGNHFKSIVNGLK